MRARIVCALVIGLVAVGALGGCATQQWTNNEGLPTASNPEYLFHPLRLVTLPIYFAGNVIQYGLVEPFYFALAKSPEAVGLSTEEQRYLADRQAAWEKFLAGERKMVE